MSGLQVAQNLLRIKSKDSLTIVLQDKKTLTDKLSMYTLGVGLQQVRSRLTEFSGINKFFVFHLHLSILILRQTVAEVAVLNSVV